MAPIIQEKTTALQALALWNYGIKTWFQQKGNSQSKKISIALNRLNIIQVPVLETRYFWKNTNARKQNDYIYMNIAVGIDFEGKIEECNLIFRYFSPEVIYCYPDDTTSKNKELIEYAANLKIDLLYPMSGIEVEEPLIQEGRINVLIGKGQTAEVLRNLCYIVTENDKENNTRDWEDICRWMEKLFYIKLSMPVLNTARGSIELKYSTDEIKRKDSMLDIALSGRGQQQMLLLMAYIFVHKNSILMIDEPDAHLEILRQKQVFTILKELAETNGNQIIIATHSEVFIDEAVDTNLVMLLSGEAVDLAKKQDIKNSLKNYGIENYYKARICKRILYTEGSTDFEMLKEFAVKLEHPLAGLLNDKLYNYYISDTDPVSSGDKSIDIASGLYQRNHRQHFYSLQPVVSGLKGIAVFDSDGKNKQDDIDDALATVYWKKYELENYFINPDNIIRFVKDYYNQEEIDLFNQQNDLDKRIDLLNSIVNNTIHSEFITDNEAWEAYFQSGKALQRTLFNSVTENKKMSRFLEKIFLEFSHQTNLPVLLNKGQFHRIIRVMDKESVDKEIIEKLDLIYKYLKQDQNQ